MTKTLNNFFASSFIILDFILTFLGINLFKIVKEGNPFMVWLFELPFYISLLYVLGMSAIIFYICQIIKTYKNYKKVLMFFHFRNLGILFLHLTWIKILL